MIIGIVGKPNCGKSTFFKAATLAEVEIAAHPFTTIKPNHGVGFVKVECVEEEFKVKCNPKFGYCLEGKRFIPVDMIDVAGLVPGAHEGKGMGNQFLDNLREADILVHIVDISGGTNENGEIVNRGSYDVSNDIRFLEEELDMWFLGIIKKGWDKFVRDLKAKKIEISKALGNQLSGLKIDEEIVKDVIRDLKLEDVNEWKADELKKLSSGLRKKSKPMIIACNKIDVDVGNFDKLKEEFKDYLFIACSAESELALREAGKKNLIRYIPGDSEFEIIGEVNDKQKKGLEFIKERVLEKYGSSGVQDVLDRAVFEFLKYIVVYPVENSKLTDKDGNKLPDAYLMKHGSNALNLAFRVHSDIGEGFIKAVNMKDKKILGKDYVLKNGDVIEIVSKK